MKPEKQTARAQTSLPLHRFLGSKGFWVSLISLLAGLYVFNFVEPHWTEQKTVYEVVRDNAGNLVYTVTGETVPIGPVVPYSPDVLGISGAGANTAPNVYQQWVSETIIEDGVEITQYSLLEAKYHFAWWSLLPALVAVALCLITREPITALGGGIVVGAFMLGKFDITGEVLIPSLATANAASLLLLYLWLLGGLLGIWSKTGAAQAFATHMSTHYVRGPRSAKCVAWLLGIIFFQGGTVSTVLVGTTVKPFADKENISHEELSYIVDSTASPIAIILAFNAWPLYVQALIFVPGVTFLATEADRLNFFFGAVPFSFYAIFAVLGTLMLSLDYTRFSGKGLRNAIARARASGELDAPDARPLSAKELQKSQVPDDYDPRVGEFLIPLGLIISIAVGTFIILGVPKVNWAFGAALLVSAVWAFSRGMDLTALLEGFGNGLRGVVVASVILMLAITVGAISKQVGGGLFLVELLGENIPFWALPVCLLAITMVTAFSTGTSWGTYAITFPLAMPLAWAVAGSQNLANPELFMALCFATVLNGSVFGDQCSPISDTTVISSMTTGCDLVDHVKTQIVPASYAATLAAVLWTATALFFA
ncbi:MAG: sodium:proton antiporter [Gammaproteobacteria bacterium]|nr:sodium:proton antiporter [Gammaproteobacteria bacterium]